MSQTQQQGHYKLLKLNADTLTPIEIYMRLDGRNKFLLESTFEHETKGKYSFIGCDPFKEVMGIGEQTTKVIHHCTNTTTTIKQDALSYLETELPKVNLDLPVPFYGGAVGYIGYDAVRTEEYIGERLPDELTMPDIHFMFVQNVIVFDHASETVYLIAIHLNGAQNNNLNKQLDNLKAQILRSSPLKTTTNTCLQFVTDTEKNSFIEKVKRAKKHIEQGDIFQVVLSQRMRAKLNTDPFSFYRQLRKVNPSPYMFYIDFTDYCLLGASPESLIQTNGNSVMTNPIAGTRSRGKTKSEDSKLMKELLHDPKEIAEHQMLVDLSRNDLGRVCEVGSIHIPTYMSIEKYEHVMHIVSEVKGKLRHNQTPFDALRACLPAGTVSGAPKIRAMQIINDLEDCKRGVYGGGIGFINFNHNISIALAIRSLVIKDNYAYLQTGAGVVFDSDPEKEYEETLFKAKSLTEVRTADDFIN
ncbi:anthranilate synthase component I [Virgibacillus sp. Bac330]|uniref:anthranilate synthase component I n=1 Tax=Virgibacillus sp. Bac330 TaxID=2419841 RepID=UPI000EF53B26|nr:anthranilate synthase component I [Virgibacillus sp. Bac330]